MIYKTIPNIADASLSFLVGSFIKMLKFAIYVLYIKFILLFRGMKTSGD
jgi:hypothetical protein